MKFDLSGTLRATPAQVDYILRLCAEIQEEGAIPLWTRTSLTLTVSPGMKRLLL